MRRKSTSGAFVTALVIKLIEKGEHDSAFVLPFKSFYGEPARLIKTNRKDEIINCGRSKYIPVSVFNFVKSLKDYPESKK